VKILFIMGSGRSGTTILDNVLAEPDGFFTAGELRYLWQRGILGRGECGAGDQVTDCEVWSAVLGKLGEDGSMNAEAIARWQDTHLRTRHTLHLLRQRPGRPSNMPGLNRYVDLLSRLHRAIAEVTAARVVIDSSKRPSDAAVLRLVPGVESYFLHMVRDPRAVAFSWKRPKAWRSDGSSKMRLHGPLYSTTQWLAYNLGAENVMRHVQRARSMRVRYEDFIRAPMDGVARIGRWIGEVREPSPFVDQSTVRLSGNHSVSGNPSRFATGPVTIRDDDEWMRRQREADQLLVTAIALPLLSRYGYPLRLGRSD
jgi:hypothetical protein